MKNLSQAVTSTGTVDNNSAQKMGIDQDGLGHLMSILSNMYDDSYEAVAREYPANALDSHVESGQTRPIEVTLPTVLSPSFLVQDYGLGMSRDDVINLYSQYGKSTKQGGNETVGGFGIGSKSAFTMGSQFIVTAVKDGRKVTVLFTMGEDNIPEYNILGDVETDEPNGVLVSLAVSDIDRMVETARRVFSTWDPETILVNGKRPESVFDRARKINDEVCIVPDHEDGVFVTLGPVAYPISSRQLTQVVTALKDTPAYATALTLAHWSNNNPGTSSLFFRANVGDMQIAPNREGLRDTRATINTLASLITGLHQDLITSVQSGIDAAPSYYEAALEYRRASEALEPLKVPRTEVSFQGRPIRTEIEVKMTTFSVGSKSWKNTAKVVREATEMTVDTTHAPRVVVVAGLKHSDFSKVRRYVKRFTENTEFDYVMVTEATAACYGWFEFGTEHGVKTITLDEWRLQLREMRDTVVRTVNEPSYTVGVGATASRDLEERELLSDILSWGKDLVVFFEKSPRGPLAEEVLADYTPVVLLGTQSESALAKRVEADGTVKIVDLNVHDEVVRLANERLSQISDDEKFALGARAWLSNYSQRTLQTWTAWNERSQVLGAGVLPEAGEIEDMVETITLVAQDITSARYEELKSLARYGTAEIESFSVDYEIPSLGEVYPLLGNISTYEVDYRPTQEQNRVLVADIVTYILAKNS